MPLSAVLLKRHKTLGDVQGTGPCTPSVCCCHLSRMLLSSPYSGIDLGERDVVGDLMASAIPCSGAGGPGAHGALPQGLPAGPAAAAVARPGRAGAGLASRPLAGTHLSVCLLMLRLVTYVRVSDEMSVVLCLFIKSYHSMSRDTPCKS